MIKIKQTAPPVRPKALVGNTGLVELEYVGRADGTVTWWGPVTGHQYKSGKGCPRIYVDAKDVDKALMDWKEHGVCVFKRAEIRRPAPVRLPPVVDPGDIPAEKHVDAVVTEIAQVAVVDRVAPAEQAQPVVEQCEVVATDEQQQIEFTAGAQSLANERGIKLADLWQGERITKRDVERWLETHNGDTCNV